MREHVKKGDQRGDSAVDGAEPEGRDLRAMAAMQRRHKTRSEAQREPTPEEKAQAGQFKQAMKGKVAGVVTTVAQATNLFQAAMIREKLADKSHGPGDMLIDMVVGVVFSQLTSAIKTAIGGSVIGAIVKQALSAVKSAAKGHHTAGGELELIDNIVSTATEAANRFVECAEGLIDAMSIEQAAQDMRLLSATLGAPGVAEASEGDGPDAGQVKHGIENQFLEAAGAPVTGPAQAEAMATEMLRTYKAERIKAFETPSETAEAVQGALKDPAKKEIPEAEERTGLSKEVSADKNERRRASDVGNGAE